MEETIAKASLRNAAIGSGIAVDKIQALTAQMSTLQIVNIPFPYSRRTCRDATRGQRTGHESQRDSKRCPRLEAANTRNVSHLSRNDGCRG